MKHVLVTVCLLMIAGVALGEPRFGSSFEGGNGTSFTQVEADRYSFRLERDTNSRDRQWFYFSVEGAAGRTLTFDMLDSDATNVPVHWDNVWPVVSEDGGATWLHVDGPCENDGFTFTFSHGVKSDSTQFASHFPYPFSRAKSKIEIWRQHPEITARQIGESAQGRPLVLLQLTDNSASYNEKMGVWVLARQHAAEVPSSFMLEGFLDFLLSEEPEAKRLRTTTVFNIIPFMNPDGAFVGNSRDNYNGRNLNRCWNPADIPAGCPEVAHARRVINEWVAAGNDYSFFIDLHSISGPRPHFAYHGGPRVTSPEYFAETEHFLALVNQFAPHFDHERGKVEAIDERVALHGQRAEHGAYTFTFEAGTNQKEIGPQAEEWLTIGDHRAVGVAIAKALLRFQEQGQTSPPGQRVIGQ